MRRCSSPKRCKRRYAVRRGLSWRSCSTYGTGSLSAGRLECERSDAPTEIARVRCRTRAVSRGTGRHLQSITDGAVRRCDIGHIPRDFLASKASSVGLETPAVESEATMRCDPSPQARRALGRARTICEPPHGCRTRSPACHHRSVPRPGVRSSWARVERHVRMRQFQAGQTVVGYQDDSHDLFFILSRQAQGHHLLRGRARGGVPRAACRAELRRAVGHRRPAALGQRHRADRRHGRAR